MNRTLACKSREEKVQYTVLFSPLLSKRSPWRPRVCGSPVVCWKKGVKPKEAESRKRAPRGRGRKLLRIRRTGERREGGTWVSCAETHDAEGMCACVAWLLVSTCAAGLGERRRRGACAGRGMEVGWFGGRRMKVRAPLKDSWLGGASVCGRHRRRRRTHCTTIPERRDEAAQKSRQAEGRKRAPRGRGRKRKADG